MQWVESDWDLLKFLKVISLILFSKPGIYILYISCWFYLNTGSFENEEDATEFVKCKIESMFTHEHKTGEGQWNSIMVSIIALFWYLYGLNKLCYHFYFP